MVQKKAVSPSPRDSMQKLDVPESFTVPVVLNKTKRLKKPIQPLRKSRIDLPGDAEPLVLEPSRPDKLSQELYEKVEL